MRARLADVARRAGVSTKTVSNVVRDYQHVSPAMRQRVLAAIEELGYVPNRTARMLRTGRTGLLALALPDLSVPYFAEIARHVTSAAEERGYTILIDQTEGREDRERTIAAGLRNDVIDGLIFNPLRMLVPDIAAAADATPMVMLGERDHPLHLDHVAIDSVAAARDATEHLLAGGRRRVAAVGDTAHDGTHTASLRMSGYRAALEGAGLAWDPALVPPVEMFSREDGARATERLLALPDPPDGIVYFSDVMAIGGLSALRRQGVTVPERVAVIGVDDIEEGRYSAPTLSSVGLDKAALARTAVDLLLARVAGSDAAPQDVVVPHHLVMRESSATAVR